MTINDVLDNDTYRKLKEELNDIKRKEKLPIKVEGEIYILETQYVEDSFASLVINAYTNTVYFFRRKKEDDIKKLVGFYSIYENEYLGILRGRKTYAEQLKHLCGVFGFGVEKYEFDKYRFAEFILDIVEIVNVDPKYVIGDFLIDSDSFLRTIDQEVNGKVSILTESGTFTDISIIGDLEKQIIIPINMFSFLR